MITNWLKKLQARLDVLHGLNDDEGVGMRPGFGSYGDYRSSLWQRLAGRSPEILDAAEDVAAEQQGRLAIISRQDEANRWLLAYLRQQPLTPAAGRIGREGFFTLVHLPEQTEADPPTAADELWQRPFAGLYTDDVIDLLTGMDVLLYLFPAGENESAREDWSMDLRWFARLRTAGAPLLPVLLTVGQAAVTANAQRCASLRRQLGVAPVCLEWPGKATSATLSPPGAELLTLIERILFLRSRLAIPLAQEAPAGRRLIVQRVIRTGALVTTMLGSEPVPLLDLPLQVAVQWKVALQLATIYGRPGLDARSREMLGTILLNLCVRQVAQQAVKLVPVVGWLLSGLLSGASTWVLGNALVRYYEEDRLLAAPPQFWRTGRARLQRALTRLAHLRRGDLGETETRRQGETETRRQGDMETRRQGETARDDSQIDKTTLGESS